MDKLARLNPEDRDNLTAYLDGELDENATRRIESILTSSSVARNDIEVLTRTYDLLDLLPRPTVPADFTERTVATAKLEGYRKPVTQHEWFRQLKLNLPLAGWSLGILALACLGFAMTNRWLPRNDTLLLKELPVIQNLDVYTEVGSVEFLEELSHQHQLLEEIQGAAHP